MIPAITVTALGVWLMAAPAVLGYGGAAATISYIVGPLVISFGTLAVWAIMRGVRLVNVALGAVLVIAPVVVGHPGVAAVNSVAVGICVAVLSLMGGRTSGRYGGGWSVLWRRHEAPVEESQKEHGKRAA